MPTRTPMPLYVRIPLAALALTVIISVGWIILTAYRVHRFFHDQNAAIKSAADAMQRPENYKPAELYLARLVQSDPAIWKSDTAEPPDWLPPELGKLQPHDADIAPDLAVLGGGGGFIDFFGYHLWRGPSLPDAKSSSFTLHYIGDQGDVTLDQFTLRAADHIDEPELVKSALAELSRRQTAFANGSQLNIYGDDPAADRIRLLSQHPALAAQLGYTVPATHPGMTLTPGR
jgi:hypothetical protein